MERFFPRIDRREPQTTRWAYGLTGLALVFWGLRRKSILGSLVSAVGADFVTRGVAGHHLHELLGLGDASGGANRNRIPHQLGVQVRASIKIDVSRRQAYEFVRNFENLPRFMKHLKSVETRDRLMSQWTARGPEGVEAEWGTEIINDIPDELLAWRSIDNAHIESAGSVHFETAARGGTIVRVSLQYRPTAGALGALLSALFGRDPERQLRENLRTLKQLLESGEAAVSMPIRDRADLEQGDAAEAY